MAIEQFKSIIRFRVPFCDIDMLQHVNNAAYVVWAETARCTYVDEVLGESLNGANGNIVAKLEVEYKRTLEYREQVAIGCRVSRIGIKSFVFSCEIWSETSNQLAAHVDVVMVAFNHETKSTVPVPQKWRDLILAHEIVPPTTGA